MSALDRLFAALISSQIISLCFNKIGRKTKTRYQRELQNLIAQQNLIQQQLSLGHNTAQHQQQLATVMMQIQTIQQAQQLLASVALPLQQQQQHNNQHQNNQLPSNYPAEEEDIMGLDEEENNASQQPHQQHHLRPSSSSSSSPSSSSSVASSSLSHDNISIQTTDLRGIRHNYQNEVLFEGCEMEVELGLARSSIYHSLLRALISCRSLLTLQLTHNNLDTTAIAAFVPFLKSTSSLTSLSLASNKLGIDGCIILTLAVLECPSLVSLDISHNAIMDEGGEAIAAMLAATLTPQPASSSSSSANNSVSSSNASVSTSSSSVTANVANTSAAFVSAKGKSSSQLLTFPANNSSFPAPSSSSSASFKPLHGHCSLTHLDVSNCSLYAAGTRAIILSLVENNTLQTLLMSKNFCLGEGASLCGTMLAKNTRLQRLDLSYNSIGEEMLQIRDFSKGLQMNTSLTELHLAGNELGVVAAKELSNALKYNHKLKILLLHDNLLASNGMKELAIGLRKNTSLTLLHLCDNSIQDKGLEFLAKSLYKNQTLQRLHIAGNEIQPAGINALGKALEKNTAVRALDLSWNRFGPAGAASLATLLSANSTLKELYTSHNKIFDDGLSTLIESLKVNTGLQYLDISQNRIKARGITQLAAELYDKNHALLVVECEQASSATSFAELARVNAAAMAAVAANMNNGHANPQQIAAQQAAAQQLSEFNQQPPKREYQKQDEQLVSMLQRNAIEHCSALKLQFLMAMHPRVGQHSYMGKVMRESSLTDMSVLREVFALCWGPLALVSRNQQAKHIDPHLQFNYPTPYAYLSHQHDMRLR